MGGYRFELSTENNQPLRAGSATMVTVKITGPDGKPAANLEPIMAAFAHGVAFPADLSGVTHVHPMGKEPEKSDDRGGPELSFHLLPANPGFLRFYVQVQIGGEGHDQVREFRPERRGRRRAERSAVRPTAVTTPLARREASRRPLVRPRDYQGDFAFGRVGAVVFQQLRRAAPAEFLELLGQLPRDARQPVRRVLREDFQGAFDPVRRLEERRWFPHVPTRATPRVRARRFSAAKTHRKRNSPPTDPNPPSAVSTADGPGITV